ncbi:hypothetical protein BJY01DRAFT_251798 [Aspergillus pseudoustus]|uniref:Uncharacterized protein n=1 Tax=Aspergillus pseudoustus TaxID=1810923 RepID=A0ABR4J9P1_9EURO
MAWLAAWLQEVKALEVIPVNYAGFRGLFTGSLGPGGGAIVKNILQRKYGFPNNFREAE